MDYQMLAILLTGNLVLVLGILTYREPGETLQSTVRNAIAWGTGFFVTFGAEMLMIANY